MSECGEIIQHFDGRVLRLVLSNPKQRNALTPHMLTALERALRSAGSDDRVRVIVLRGEGDVFSSGYAVGSFPRGDDLHEHDELTTAGDALASCPKATLALLNGDAIGAALDLALAADFRIAIGEARVGITPAKFGIIYPWQGVQRAVNTLGGGLARRLLLTAQLVPASALLSRGGIDEVVPSADELRLAESRWLETLLRAAPLSVAGTKHVLRIVERGAPTEAERRDILELRRRAIDSDDAKEAARAFRERRQPEFVGR